MALSKDDVKSRLAELIEKHQRFKNEGRLKGINEEMTKQWIDDLFRILGWDFIEDVLKEYGTGKRKRVDYAFQIAGTTKFLLEAKAYGEELDEKHIKQTLEYGYQNNKTWVVLTNFREIRVYNAKYYDKEEHIRRLYEPLRIEDAVARFDDLWVLSREGMKEGLINQLANKYGKVKPKEAIDSLIFEDLMRWRKALEKGIKAHERLNRLPTEPEAAESYIDEAVQKLLDRIIFVRVCEDRGLEEEELLRWCVREWKANKKVPLMSYLSRLFSKKNGEYNSGIFASHFSESLTIENEILEAIIEESYVNPNGLTYDFSAIDADILGTIYENYLAYIQKRVWDKEGKQKSKRKAHGIYYTPTYIVDYIVKNTLGEKLKGCTRPEEALQIKVLDPACGSGSFLIRAYDEFKIWYASHMRKNGERQHTPNQEIKGTREFMDKVLENCIYGVDLDPKAVEIAQLNLLLKAAEGKHKLPTLNHTIQCGNSLIDDPAVAGERAFKWEEKFPEVFRNGGFDVVVGNPPWVRAKVSCSENDLGFLRRIYGAYSVGELNLYKLFMVRSLQLIKNKGDFSFITPSSYLSDRDSIELRRWMLNEYSILRLIIFSEKATKDMFEITQATTIITVKHQKPTLQTKSEISELLEETEGFKTKQLKLISITQSDFLNTEDAQIFSGRSEAELKLIEKLSGYPKMKENISTRDGEVHLTKYSKFIIDNPSAHSAILVRGNHLSRYLVNLDKKDRVGGWLELDGLQLTSDFYKKRRIVVQQVSNMAQKYRIKGGIIEPNVYAGNSCVSIISAQRTCSLEYILGLLNSKLLNWYFKFFSSTNHVTGRELQNLPYPKKNDDIAENIQRLTLKIVSMSKQLLNNSNQNSNDAQALKAQIERTDKEIDRLVYELYGLSEDEIKIVEEAVK